MLWRVQPVRGMQLEPVSGLGAHVRTHSPRGGFTGFQNRPGVRTFLLAAAGLFVGIIPGLFVALIADFLPALIIGALVGAIGGYVWASRLDFSAAVSEARLHEGGVVLVDGRGTHVLTWGDVAVIQGKHVQTVLGTGIAGVGDTKGVTEHTYLLRTRGGSGFWLDDRISDVVPLVETIARGSGANVSPMR